MQKSIEFQLHHYKIPQLSPYQQECCWHSLDRKPVDFPTQGQLLRIQQPVCPIMNFPWVLSNQTFSEWTFYGCWLHHLPWQLMQWTPYYFLFLRHHCLLRRLHHRHCHYPPLLWIQKHRVVCPSLDSCQELLLMSHYFPYFLCLKVMISHQNLSNIETKSSKMRLA